LSVKSTRRRLGASSLPQVIQELRCRRADFLWEELLEAAREDGNLLSFFVVNEAKGNVSESIYVSPDWPSAEAFAKKRIVVA
jgi:hypothetical protein